MAHYLFNFATGDRDEAAARLQAEMWGIGADERHRDALTAGDLALIYVATSGGEFIGQAELSSAPQEWTPREARAYPGSSPGGVRLCRIERWSRAVPTAIIAAQVDPTGSNPVVQANVRDGFRSAVVRITPAEYEAAVAASRAYQRR